MLIKLRNRRQVPRNRKVRREGRVLVGRGSRMTRWSARRQLVFTATTRRTLRCRAEPVPAQFGDDSPVLSFHTQHRGSASVLVQHSRRQTKSSSLREIQSLFESLAPPFFAHSPFRPLARLWLLSAQTTMQFLPWIAFGLAAIFEVGGDAVIRMGIKSNNLVLILLGAGTLGGYGLIVNSVDWDFGKIFGVYVGAFALAAILFGKFLFREQIPVTTWIGLLIIISGGLVIQFGQK